MREPTLALSDPPSDEVKSTTCYMCACRCGIKVHLRDGRIRYIQGNREHPVNKGVLCAKGSAGIMQHYSPARLNAPLKRIGPRGSGEFVEITWDEALTTAAGWLGAIRKRNPNELAFFTGRDQSQALTGWWAQAFGTVNYAAHGGFCSVNMAAAGLYTLGGSFWEFGEPDWEHCQMLLMWGVAEDHDSNPLKMGLGKLKERGAKVVAINPIQTGYAAIADEWIAIRPGTDGLLIGALIQQLLRADQIAFDYLVRYTNAHWLVIDAPGAPDDGLFARDAGGEVLCFDRAAAKLVRANGTGFSPAIAGSYQLADGRNAKPAFEHIALRFLQPDYAAETVAEQTGVPAATIRKLAAELAHAAFQQQVELPIAWTDTHGVRHPSMIGHPVAMHAMRGISAHANGFQTCRALHVLQLLLGAVDTPGSFRHQPPYPKPIPLPNRPGKNGGPDGKLTGMPLGVPHGPEDLLVNAQGEPLRIDHAFSWAHPLSVHGMLHTVIRNAWAQDPYPIDTLLLFMANMSWNSAMNTAETISWLTDKQPNSEEYRIPRIIYSDAYYSETVAYADLVLPDTTYLERHDCISMLDRPISDADGAADGIRQPVLAPDRDVRPFQSVLLDLGARLGLPGMLDSAGAAKYPGGFAEYIVQHERLPDVGLLAGWRGTHGEKSGKGPPNPQQLERYIENGCFWRQEVPESARYYKFANREYLDWAVRLGFLARHEPVVAQLYSETLQKFRLAARGHGAIQPPEALRARVARYFDPVPNFEPIANPEHGGRKFALYALTQRPMFMYHAWGSQNAWLRQIATRNRLYLHDDLAAEHGLRDDDWVYLSSAHARIKCQIQTVRNVERNTVWTWNAIGKRKGAWNLDPKSAEGTVGFLLNHLISDLDAEKKFANADPITGQAAWFDLRVNIEKCPANEAQESAPQFAALPGQGAAPTEVLRYGAGFRK